MSKVVVLGGTGTMGSKVVDELRRRGHQTTSASRASGVDVTTGGGLGEALTGADCVVDCLNHTTVSRRRAEAFFSAAAEHVRRLAAERGVNRIVCLSIVNVTDARVRNALGYYGGKALQEEIYTRGPVPLTVIRTTAWFSLAEMFLNQIRLGRFAVVPRMGLQPVHPDAAATAIVEAVEHGPDQPGATNVRELAGPEQIDATELVRRFAAVAHPGMKIVAMPMPMAGLREGLLPHEDVPVDTRRFEDWLDGVTPGSP